MGDKSAIEWTDHTFNPWWGCWRVSPGCDRCYADTWARRTGHNLWDNGNYRYFREEHWNEPYRWNRRAWKDGVRRRVFCGSMCDWADNKTDPLVRDMLWETIRACTDLDWLMLTKRIGNVPKMLPPDWGDGWQHVVMMVSIVNQEEADRDLPKLLALPAARRGVSYEPALGPVDFRRVATHGGWYDALEGWRDVRQSPAPEGKLDWIIVGGESGRGARPFDVQWARDTIAQCKAAGVACFYKQGGASNACAHDRKGGCFDCFPDDLKVREFPVIEAAGRADG